MSPAHPRADDDDHARNRSSQRNASWSSIGTRCPTRAPAPAARAARANEPARKSGWVVFAGRKSNAGTPASSPGVGRLLGLALLQLKRCRCIADHPRRSGGALASATATAAVSKSPRSSAASAAPSGQQPLERVQARRRGRDQQQRARSRRRSRRHPQRHRAAERDPHGANRSWASASTTPRVLRPGPHRRLAEPRQVGCDRAEPRQRQYVRPHRAVRHARVLQHQRWTNTHLVVQQCHGSRRYATVVAISLETTIAR